MSKFNRNRIKDGWKKLCTNKQTNKQTNRQTDTTKLECTIYIVDIAVSKWTQRPLKWARIKVDRPILKSAVGGKGNWQLGYQRCVSVCLLEKQWCSRQNKEDICIALYTDSDSGSMAQVWHMLTRNHTVLFATHMCIHKWNKPRDFRILHQY